MASSSFHLLHIFFLISSCVILTSQPKPLQPATFKPNKLVLPLQKDQATHLFTTSIHKRTPLQQVSLVVHLNGQFLWVACEPSYLSSTYHAPLCHSTQCARADTPYCHTCKSSTQRPGCHNNTCGIMATNPVTHQAAMGELAQDVLAVQSTTGSNPGRLVKVPAFLFACATASLLQNALPRNVQGVAGLGHAPISLPYQLASHFGFPPKFALCLPSSAGNVPNGAVFFGDGPYMMLPGIDVSTHLRFTPLTISPEGHYYITLTSIRINNKQVPINASLLNFNVNAGTGGTKLSTIKPYTVLEHSIYKTFTNFFTRQLPGIPLTKPVAPFSVCYDSSKLASTRTGPGVPNIDFVMQNQNVKWTVAGANSMVQARNGVTCLAFVDGGARPPRASIVIGSHQLQDNLLQFDLAGSRLGFSSSLLFRRTSCSNFNFTNTTP